jgi:hypothetical protein
LRDTTVIPVAPGARVYCRVVDVAQARHLLNPLSLGTLSLDQASPILDKTTSAVAAWYASDAQQRFMAVAHGKYPQVQAQALFTFSSDWSQRSSPNGSYWYSTSNNIAVSLNANQVLVSDRNPLAFGSGVRYPQDFESLSNSAILGFWFDRADLINEFLASRQVPMQIPAERVLIFLYEAAQQYTINAHFVAKDEATARGLISLFSVIRPFISNLDKKVFPLVQELFLKTPTVEGTSVIVQSGPFSAEELVLLFSNVSLL